MLSIGTRTYNLTDFNQDLRKCPSCNENGLFLSQYVHFFQINSLPIFSKNVVAKAHCRKCEEQFKKSSNEEIQRLINEANATIVVPKYLKAGALLYPLAIGSVIAFFMAFK